MKIESMQMERDGCQLVTEVLPPSMRERLVSALGPTSGAGTRGLLGVPEVAALAASEQIVTLVRPHTGGSPRPVRAIWFDKTPESNWLVAWHQDLTVAVETRAESPGWGPWSVKNGIPHVQPPAECLEQMLTVRIHLDPADGTNGALRVLPGTHCLGRLAADRIQEMRATQTEVLCKAAAGDALLMRPLLLHSSSRAVIAHHRRVLHLEYAAFTLPPGLAWHRGA